MPKSLFTLKREGSTANALEVIEVGGVVSLKLNNTRVISAQSAAEPDVGAATATVVAAAIPAAAPAGGVGAAAGGWDTAVNRDAAIATINGLQAYATEQKADFGAMVTDVASIRTTLNDLLAKLRTHGIIAT